MALADSKHIAGRPEGDEQELDGRGVDVGLPALREDGKLREPRRVRPQLATAHALVALTHGQKVRVANGLDACGRRRALGLYAFERERDREVDGDLLVLCNHSIEELVVRHIRFQDVELELFAHRSGVRGRRRWHGAARRFYLFGRATRSARAEVTEGRRG